VEPSGGVVESANDIAVDRHYRPVLALSSGRRTHLRIPR
jgi:hypothetical protein